MRARRMAHDQHLVHIRPQRLRDGIPEFGHARFKRGRVRPARRGPEGVIMHQVIGEKLAILFLEPAQHLPAQPHASGGDDPLEPRRPAKEGQPRVQQLAREGSDQQLQQQHPHRIKRRNHGPLAQLHQPPKRTRRDIDPSRLHQLPIGREDRIAHGDAHNVGPDEHVDLSLYINAIDMRGDVPAVVPAALLGRQRDLIVRDPRLCAAFLAVKLAVAARMNGVVARDIENPSRLYCLLYVLGHRSPCISPQLKQVFRQE